MATVRCNAAPFVRPCAHARRTPPCAQSNLLGLDGRSCSNALVRQARGLRSTLAKARPAAPLGAHSLAQGPRRKVAVAATGEPASSGGLVRIEQPLQPPPADFEPRVDTNAALSFVGIFLVIAVLQVRAGGVARARERRDQAEKELQKLQVQALTSGAGKAASHQLLEAREQLERLAQAEDDAATLFSLFGLKFRFITPRPLGTPVEDLESYQPPKPEVKRQLDRLERERAHAEERARVAVFAFLSVAMLSWMLVVMIMD
mmetsp:Transcript_12849/g.46976  ORF Transcript_12849/g.46976 Transcript_12849/m.46976 type:complete len:260 (+) Transcript_12849:99-878(+)